jgi:hypothetical protein
MSDQIRADRKMSPVLHNQKTAAKAVKSTLPLNPPLPSPPLLRVNQAGQLPAEQRNSRVTVFRTENIHLEYLLAEVALTRQNGLKAAFP